jgi:glycosyltransferase involved in cell wall biosynthesis
MNNYRVTLVSTRNKGGAGIATSRLHKGLLQSGFQSNFLIQKGDLEPETFLIDNNSSVSFLSRRFSLNFFGKVKYFKLKKEYKKLNYFRENGLDKITLPRTNTYLHLNKTVSNCDIINLHWVAGILDWPSFFRGIQKPLIWTLHDENPFLGLQHYENEFLGVDNKGKPILRIRTEYERKSDELVKLHKKKWLSKIDNLTVVTPSEWLLNKSKNSEILGRFNHTLIPNGLPENIYKCLNKNEVRALLGLPSDKYLLLFVADDVNNRRKGYDFFVRALNELDINLKSDIGIVTVGKNHGIYSQNINFDFGYIDNDELMAMIYNAVDTFVIPSIEDNLPNTMLEALMCGTPVVGFPVGGIKETIENGVNGLLASEISTSSLANTIEAAYKNYSIFNKVQISLKSHQKYSLAVQSGSYIKLINEILN